MNKIVFVLITITLLGNTIYAKSRKPHITKEKIGQRYYLKRCSSCHGPGKMGGNINSIYEWKLAFNNNAKELIELHTSEENTQDVIKYLTSKDFKKEKKRMLKFLQEFAYDSESIPTCN